jgi:hypothetical protein
MDDSLFTCNINLEEINIDSDLLTGDFKTFVNDISCLICQNIVYKPVCCSNCSALFCTKCINDWLKKSRQCPNRCNYIGRPIDRLFQRLLSSMKMKCLFNDKGCTSIVNYEELEKHFRNECKGITYKCKGCDFVSELRMMEMHVNVCDGFHEKCPFCKLVFQKKVLGDHIANCPEKEDECIYCEQKFKIREKENHVQTCLEWRIECLYCKTKYKRKLEGEHTKDACFAEYKLLVSKQLNLDQIQKQVLGYERKIQELAEKLASYNEMEVKFNILIRNESVYKNNENIYRNEIDMYKAEIQKLKTALELANKKNSKTIFLINFSISTK